MDGLVGSTQFSDVNLTFEWIWVIGVVLGAYGYGYSYDCVLVQIDSVINTKESVVIAIFIGVQVQFCHLYGYE